MAGFTQANRLMQFTSPLGKDVLLIESLGGREEISCLFEYHIELLAEADTVIDPKAMIGAKVAVALSLNDAQGSRWINGIVASFEQCAGDSDFRSEADTVIDPKAMIGAKVAVALSLNDAQGPRWINGIVASFEQCAGDSEFDAYRARIVPSMWQLTLSSNCRV